VLSERAMASSWRWVHWDRSADLGRYWRRRPLVFSLLPRCQGLLGSPRSDTRHSIRQICASHGLSVDLGRAHDHSALRWGGGER
jgi:hypothetical protein